ncbi:hypothetical protein EK21DRAFT_84935 [Setomelanomma holmii]|uniref:Uncharacterized protein n=1 Tax=Setomelanomma holmii TaxID=210430 RepID=A0A9P4HGK9_9PLEO|nr:hypothetical protein EK21DRAFT_84935 [Setomelanomma holmii]
MLQELLRAPSLMSVSCKQLKAYSRYSPTQCALFDLAQTHKSLPIPSETWYPHRLHHTHSYRETGLRVCVTPIRHPGLAWDLVVAWRAEAHIGLHKAKPHGGDGRLNYCCVLVLPSSWDLSTFCAHGNWGMTVNPEWIPRMFEYQPKPGYALVFEGGSDSCRVGALLPGFASTVHSDLVLLMEGMGVSCLVDAECGLRVWGVGHRCCAYGMWMCLVKLQSHADRDEQEEVVVATTIYQVPLAAVSTPDEYKDRARGHTAQGLSRSQ